MRVIKKACLVMAAMTLLLSLGNLTAFAAKPPLSLKAAFVRGGDLWIKTGGVEQRLTKGQYIRSPKWSIDGKWIAYTRGQEGREVWLWHVPTGQNHLVTSAGDGSYQWAPNQDIVAFVAEQKLNWIHPDKPDKPVEVAPGIGNYSWLPNGSGFIASTAAELLPSGWTQVRILEIPLTDKADPKSIKTLYVLPKQSNGFFAVGTSIFKFSATGRWIAFLATPTASLSADSNTLCVLSSDGAVFNKVDEMANNDQWFNWAEQDNTLAYIGGVGREATSNKQLKVIEVPDGKPVSYTPSGFVDQSFTWQGAKSIVVSRAKELQASSGTAAKPFPFLVEVKPDKERSKRVTQPSNAQGDFNPQFLSKPQRLTWVRSNRTTASVMVAEKEGKQPSVWITNIDLGANFNEQWRWSDVLSFYSR
ncbi:TolB family protein [Cohnella silvisoli]|uniref:Translocation protein TolB n=1 Tax=Cohnella silvisoli TaxID=2873699 RepID=A0ABV1KQ58_9BACL|nr:translocation protein TolB [Cohnella silvisoli]MCD9022123.1 translocation protein TolB [Cohnella silvisoli]